MGNRVGRFNQSFEIPFWSGRSEQCRASRLSRRSGVIMRIPLNLSSEPFRRDRPMIVASVAVGILMAGVLSMLIWLYFAERGEMADTREAIARLETRVASMSAEQARLESILRQPQNAEVLERSIFLNSLLMRKGISWTRIFSDLESVMPYNVRLISVRPEVTAENEILLAMNVASAAREPVIEMIKRLETTPQFGAAAVTGPVPPGQTEPVSRHRIG